MPTSFFEVKKGANSFDLCSGGIPIPLSAMVIRTPERPDRKSRERRARIDDRTAIPGGIDGIGEKVRDGLFELSLKGTECEARLDLTPNVDALVF